VTDHIVYDPYGNILSQTNPANQPRFGFDGMQLDQATGSYYDNARYYDSSTGTFISRDPLGFGGGSSNLYDYVSNKPTKLSDPTGMGEVLIGLGGIFGFADPFGWEGNGTADFAIGWGPGGVTVGALESIATGPTVGAALPSGGAGVDVGYYPSVTNVTQLSGLGWAVGAAGGPGDSDVWWEPPAGQPGGVWVGTPVGVGATAGAYATVAGSYTWTQDLTPGVKAFFQSLSNVLNQASTVAQIESPLPIPGPAAVALQYASSALKHVARVFK
jgi:RHS repeat-associated protein